MQEAIRALDTAVEAFNADPYSPHTRQGVRDALEAVSGEANGWMEDVKNSISNIGDDVEDMDTLNMDDHLIEEWNEPIDKILAEFNSVMEELDEETPNET